MLERGPDGRLTESAAEAVFGAWSFPVRNLTQAQMARVADEQGFLDLLVQRWSCHTPVLGLARGCCKPCQKGLRQGVHYAPAAVAVPALKWQRGAGFLRRRLESTWGADRLPGSVRQVHPEQRVHGVPDQRRCLGVLTRG